MSFLSKLAGALVPGPLGKALGLGSSSKATSSPALSNLAQSFTNNYQNPMANQQAFAPQMMAPRPNTIGYNPQQQAAMNTMSFGTKRPMQPYNPMPQPYNLAIQNLPMQPQMMQSNPGNYMSSNTPYMGAPNAIQRRVF